MLSDTEDEWDDSTLGNSEWEGRLFLDQEQPQPRPGAMHDERGRASGRGVASGLDTDDLDSDAGGDAQPFEESDVESGGDAGGWTRVTRSRDPHPPQWRWQPPLGAIAVSHGCPVVVEAQEFEDKGTVSEEPRTQGIAAAPQRPGSAERPSAAATAAAAVRTTAPAPHRPAWRFPAAPSHTVAPRPGAGEVITAACVLSGGQVVITAATPPYVASPTIRVWSRVSASLVCTLQRAPGEAGGVNSASPGLRAPATCLAADNGAILAGACSGEAVMYNAGTGRVAHRLLVPPGGGSGAITCMAVAPGPGPRRAALGTIGGFLRIWTPGAPEGQPRLLAVNLGRTTAPSGSDASNPTAENNGSNSSATAATPRQGVNQRENHQKGDAAPLAAPPRQQAPPPLPVVAVAFSPDGLFVFAACAAAAGAAASTGNRVSRVYIFDLLAGECVVSRHGMEVPPALAARVNSSGLSSSSASASNGRCRNYTSGIDSSSGGTGDSDRNGGETAAVGLGSCLPGCEATLANGSTWAPRVNVTLSDARAAFGGGGSGDGRGGSGNGSGGSTSNVLGRNGTFLSVSSCAAGFSSPGTSSASTVVPVGESETAVIANTPVRASDCVSDAGNGNDCGYGCGNGGTSGNEIINGHGCGDGGKTSGNSGKTSGNGGKTSSNDGIFVASGRGTVAFGTFLAGNGGELLVWDARRLVAPLLPSERRELMLLRRLCQDRRARPKAATRDRVVAAGGRHAAPKKGFLSALFGCGGGVSSAASAVVVDGGVLLGVAGVGKGLEAVVARAVRLEERVFRHMASFI